MNLLGWPFCAKCKENKFQSTGTRKTTRQTRAKTAPATCQKNHPQNVNFGSQHGAKIPSKSLPEACRRPLAPQDAPKTQPRAANATKKTPRASQERSKSAGKRFSGRPVSRTEAPLGSGRTAGRGRGGIVEGCIEWSSAVGL